MHRTLIVPTALAAMAVGLSAESHAARFTLTANNYIYNGSFADAGASRTEHELVFGGGSIDGRSPSIAFSSNGTLYASINFNSGSPVATNHALFTVGGYTATTATLSLVGQLASNTPSFDFVGTGAAERMIGVRNAPGNSRFFESNDATFSGFTEVGPTGLAAAFPSTAWTGSRYIGVLAGGSEASRLFYTIDTTSGAASALLDGGNNHIALTFASDPYGTIALSGGDYAGGEYYISFYSSALDAAIVGTVDLTNGVFSELARFDVNGAPPEAMGLAIVIPAPLAGGMGVAGLMVLGARRRRNG